MEYDINHIFIIDSSFIAILFYLLSKSLLILALIGGNIFMLFVLYIYNNFDRKERLNIIKDKNTLYFHLSDDYLFSVELKKDDTLSDILVKTVKQEMATIKKLVDRIDFVNFKDDRLNQKLNALIESEI